jgi:hypothetical protein
LVVVLVVVVVGGRLQYSFIVIVVAVVFKNESKSQNIVRVKHQYFSCCQSEIQQHFPPVGSVKWRHLYARGDEIDNHGKQGG